jgi:hypothetical protein
MDAKIVVPLHPNFYSVFFKDEKDCYNEPLSVVSHDDVC